MSTALNADINEIASHLRTMEDKLANLEQNDSKSEFDLFLESGQLHLYIFKRIVEARGWQFNIVTENWKRQKGNEVEIRKENSTLKLNVEFAAGTKFEIRCNDAGKPTQDDVNYFVFMNLKYIAFVKPADIAIDKPKVKENKEFNYKYYELDLQRSKIKAAHLIQYANLVI